MDFSETPRNCLLSGAWDQSNLAVDMGGQALLILFMGLQKGVASGLSSLGGIDGIH
jgi:hypothetical protein